MTKMFGIPSNFNGNFCIWIEWKVSQSSEDQEDATPPLPLNIKTLDSSTMSRENSNVMPTVGKNPPAPPPPPPPPQLLGLRVTENKNEIAEGSCYEKTHHIHLEKIRDDLRKFAQFRRSSSSEPELSRESLLVVYSHLEPTLQRGPVCGILALAMVGTSLQPSPPDPDALLAKAIAKGFTKNGEMFSANTMMELASDVYPTCDAEVMEINLESVLQLCSYIIDGGFILLPYDADFNHAPAQRKGHAAHWAVLHGVAAFTDHDEGNSELVRVVAPGIDACKGFKKLLETTDTYFIGHQGKSVHTGIWNARDCILSNLNLTEISPKILADPDAMILHDMNKELKGKVVLIKSKV